MVERPHEVAAAIARERLAEQRVIDRESAAGADVAGPNGPAPAVEKHVPVGVGNAQTFGSLERQAMLGSAGSAAGKFGGRPVGSGRRRSGARCDQRDQPQGKALHSANYSSTSRFDNAQRDREST